MTPRPCQGGGPPPAPQATSLWTAILPSTTGRERFVSGAALLSITGRWDGRRAGRELSRLLAVERGIGWMLQTPTGVQIAPGIEIRPGKAPPRRFAFSTCDARCAGSGDLGEALAREVAAAESAELAVVATNGNSVRFTFPVGGFEPALSGLKK